MLGHRVVHVTLCPKGAIVIYGRGMGILRGKPDFFFL